MWRTCSMKLDSSCRTRGVEQKVTSQPPSPPRVHRSPAPSSLAGCMTRFSLPVNHCQQLTWRAKMVTKILI